MSPWDKLFSTDGALAGLVGAIIAVRFEKELTTWRGKLFFVFTGTSCAYFTTSLALSRFGISTELSGGVGFLLGAFGASLLAAGIQAVKSVDLVALIKARFGGGN